MEFLTCFCAMLVLVFIILIPVYVSMFKNDIYEYIKSRLEADAKAKKIKKEMLKNMKK